MPGTEKATNSVSISFPALNRFVEILKKAWLMAFSRKNRIKFTLSAIILLNILDALLTNVLINNNIAHEGNLILAGVAGGPKLILIKFLGVLLAAAIIWDIYRHHPRLALVTCIAFLLMYSGIVVWNMSLLLMG